MKLRLFLTISMLWVLAFELCAQQTGSQLKYADWEREMRQEYFIPGKAPLKGYKQFERANMEWQLHLDQDGNMVNFAKENLDAFLESKSMMTPQGSSWKLVGPSGPPTEDDFGNNGVGRINTVVVWDVDTWFVGASGGGLWKTDNSGIYLPGVWDEPWENLTASLPINAIGGLVVNPANENDIYVLTGDPYNSGVPSMGIMHTADGGDNWEVTSLVFNRDQTEFGYKLVANPQDFLEQYACTSDGLYHTTDGWITSQQVVSGEFFDLEFHPTDNSIIYACTDERIYRKTGNSSFQFSDNGIVENSRRVELEVTPAAPGWVYAVYIDNDRSMGGIYLSTDEAVTWDLQMNGTYNIACSVDPEDPDDNGQGNYCMGLYADDNAPSVLFYGCVNLWGSALNGLDGTWFQITDWTSDDVFHADVHEIIRNPYNGDLVVTSDGGIYVSADNGSSWGNRSYGMSITEFYHLGVDNNFLATIEISGGAQDNGTMRIGAIGTSIPAVKLMGGDGFETAVNIFPDYGPEYYTEVQYGQLRLVDVFGQHDIYPPDDLVELGIEEKSNRFNVPYDVDPNSFEELVIGYGDLWYSADKGDDWTKIWEAPTEHLGLSPRVKSVDFGSSLLLAFIEEWDVGNNGYQNNTLWYTTMIYNQVFNGGVGWQMKSEVDLGLPSNVELSDVSIKKVLPQDAQDFVAMAVAVSGYQADYKVILYPILNMYPDSVINVTYDLPNVPVRCVEITDDGIYAGTDIGVYYLYFGATTWQDYNVGLPVVPVNEIAYKESLLGGKEIFIATHGRGIWRNSPAGTTPIRYYVDIDATGNNDGSSWTNAFTSLTTALSQASAMDTLWIAEGNYVPGGSRSSFFDVRGEILYGGFNGTETSLSERNIALYESRLSGDIGTLGVATDNCYRLLNVNESYEHCRFDGITFSGGYANGGTADQRKGACMELATYAPGVNNIYPNKRPYFIDCVFENFYSQDNGAVIYFEDFTTTIYTGATPIPETPLIFENCIFQNNSTLGGGGAIYIDNYAVINGLDISGNANIQLNGCSFYNNTAANGGAIYFNSEKTALDYTLQDVYFEGNSTTGSGGAMYVNGFNGGDLQITFSNVQFIDNTAASWGGAVQHYAGRSNSNSLLPGEVNANYLNCTFDGNQGNYGGALGLNAAANDFDDGTVTVNLTGCSMIDNYASVHGGFLYSDVSSNGSFGTFTFDDCTFTNNDADLEGGAIRIEGANWGVSSMSLNNCTFSGSNSGGRGGAVYCEAFVNGNFTFAADSCNFSQNAGDHGGALYFSTGANGNLTAHVTNSDFIDNVANGASNNSRGGAIAHNGDNVNTGIYENCSFHSNHSNERGGAFSVEATDISFSNCSFTENTGSANGGVGYIYHFYSDLERTASFDSCFFDSNSVNGGAGVIHASLSNSPPLNVVITNSTCTNNYGSNGCFNIGGGGASNVELSNCVFEQNSTTGSGTGGVLDFSASGSVNINGCLFDGNVAGNRGGSLDIDSYSNDLTINVDSCIFQNGDADLGGAIYVANDNFTNVFTNISDCEFLNNEADNGVGAVMFELFDYSEVELQRNYFFGNHALNSGYSAGALYIKTYSASDTSVFHMDSCRFESNYALGSAGALHLISDGSLRALIENSDFIENSTNIHGGASRVYVYANDFMEVDFSNCLFSGNSALSRGGAVHFETSTSTTELYGVLNQCLLIGNQAASGGALHSICSTSGAVNSLGVFNCTIADNHATTKCGGVMTERTNGTLLGNFRNNIIWGNTDLDTEMNQKQAYALGISSVEIGSSVIQSGLPAGGIDAGGVIDSDPMFVQQGVLEGADLIFRTADDGYAIAPSSPAIDSGDSFYSTIIDLAGTPRPQLNGYDMGAYEALDNALTCLGDFNGDGAIGTTDLLIFIGSYGCTESCGMPDLNDDDVVNITDLLIFVSVYGTSCQ